MSRCYYCGKPNDEGPICSSYDCVKKYRDDARKADKEFARIKTAKISTRLCSICGRPVETKSEFVRFCGSCRSDLHEGHIIPGPDEWLNLVWSLPTPGCRQERRLPNAD